jgi:hypothetical protein
MADGDGDGSGPGISWIREVGPQTVIVTDVLRSTVRRVQQYTFSINNELSVADEPPSITLHKSRPVLESLIILDLPSFIYDGSNKVISSLSEVTFLRDNFEYSHRSGLIPFLVIESPFIIGDKLLFRHNTAAIETAGPTEYLLLKDEVKKKILNTTHDQGINYPTESLFESLKINDEIDIRKNGETGINTQEIIKVHNNIDFFHLPFYGNIVYHIDYDNFTKFSKLSPRTAQNLTFGDILENKVILIDSDNKLMQYPGSEEVKKSLIETKSFYVEHGVLRQMLIDFEKGEEDIRVDSILDNADKTNTNKDTFSNISPNKWVGIKNKVSRGYAIKFVMRNFTKIKHMIFRFKTRLRE